MSRAFVKEPDGSEAPDIGPDRPVSTARNLVTAAGLKLIEATVERRRSEHAATKAAGDRVAEAVAARDLRYWLARRESAELVEAEAAPGRVVFGSAVTVERGDGRRQVFRIVGEDEADPASGTLAWTAPLSRAVTGLEAGETASLGTEELTVVAVGM